MNGLNELYKLKTQQTKFTGFVFFNLVCSCFKTKNYCSSLFIADIKSVYAFFVTIGEEFDNSFEKI
jgi:hypothetical protein